MWQLILTTTMLISVGVFIFNSLHVLNSLIVLEYMILLLYTQLCLNNFNTSTSCVDMIILFVVSVTSAAVGLALLIPLSRSHGQDYFSSFHVLW